MKYISMKEALDQIKVTNYTWPCFMDNHVGVVAKLKKFKHNFVVLEVKKFMQVAKNEELMMELIFDAMMNKKRLIIDCDAFNIEP